MPALYSKIPCNDTLNASSLCQEHSFIDASSCQDYIRINSVLCAVTIIGNQTTQTSALQIEATTYIPLFTEISTEDTKSASSDMSASISTATVTSIVSTVINTSMGSTITTASEGSNAINTFTDSTMPITSINIAISTMFTNSTTIATSINLITTVSSTVSTTTSSIVTTSSAQQTYLPGESSLGRAATAGIACGIIFSVVIFIAEIVFLKFVYPRFFDTGTDRSVAYRT